MSDTFSSEVEHRRIQSQIRADVEAGLKNSMNNAALRRVRCACSGSTVILWGAVCDNGSRMIADEIATHTANVSTVINRIQIEDAVALVAC